MLYDLLTAQFPRKPRLYRYVFFLLSSLNFRTFSEWKSEGEPNPFARIPRRRRQTSEQEIADIFEMTSREIKEFTSRKR